MASLLKDEELKDEPADIKALVQSIRGGEWSSFKLS